VFRVRMGTCARHLEAEVEKLRVREERVWLEARAATLKEWLREWGDVGKVTLFVSQLKASSLFFRPIQNLVRARLLLFSRFPTRSRVRVSSASRFVANSLNQPRMHKTRQSLIHHKLTIGTHITPPSPSAFSPTLIITVDSNPWFPFTKTNHQHQPLVPFPSLLLPPIS
jgi:hypothetical protein